LLIEIDIASAIAGNGEWVDPEITSRSRARSASMDPPGDRDRRARVNARAAAAPGVSRSEAEPTGVVPPPQRSLDRHALSRRAGRTNGVEMPGAADALGVDGSQAHAAASAKHRRSEL
jgi:hypothetical protein